MVGTVGLLLTDGIAAEVGVDALGAAVVGAPGGIEARCDGAAVAL